MISRIGKQIGSSSMRSSRLGTRPSFEMSRRLRRAGCSMARCRHIIKSGEVEDDLVWREGLRKNSGKF